MPRPVNERPPLPQPPRDERGIFGWALTQMRVLLDTFQQHGHAINGLQEGRSPIPQATYLTADIPDAADHEGAIIYVSDAAAGANFQGSIGTGWVNLG